MNPSTRLKLGSVVFAVFWIAAMLWWDGSFERANVITTTIFGAVLGYGWYRFMRWRLSHGQAPSRSGHSTGSGG
jgi:hypothetical protein